MSDTPASQEVRSNPRTWVELKLDSAARNNLAGYTFAGQVDQALEQRKMLLGVALQAFKGTTAQRTR